MDLLEFKDSLIFIENSRTASQDYTEIETLSQKKGGEGEQLKKYPLHASTHVHASYIHTKKENL